MTATSGPVRRFLRGAPPAPNAAPDAREESLLRRAARGMERFLEPERPRLAEALAFFAPTRGAGDAALLSRWEGAAAAGLIPPEWVEAPPFMFGRRPFPGGPLEVRPCPFSAEVAAAVVADVGGVLTASGLGEDVARALAPRSANRFGVGDPWQSREQWEARPRAAPVVWVAATSASQPNREQWVSGALLDAVRGARPSAPELARRAERAADLPWITEMAARQRPSPSSHLRRFSKVIPYDWWGAFVRAAGSVVVADVARELRLGPYAFDDDLPNPFERILGVWEAGYNWQGETSEPAGVRTAWVMELRADDFGGRPAL